MEKSIIVKLVDIEERKNKLKSKINTDGSVNMLHFKGDTYKVFAVARHTESDEELVAYKCVYSNNPSADLDTIWVRPIDMFLSPVDLEKYPNCQYDFRFMFLEDAQREMYQLLHGEN